MKPKCRFYFPLFTLLLLAGLLYSVVSVAQVININPPIPNGHYVEVATSTFDANNQTNVNATAGYFKKMPFPNVVSDAEKLWSATNFWYTAPEAGRYVIITVLRPQDGLGAGKRYGQGAGLTNSDGPTYLWTATNAVSNGSYNQRIMALTAGQQVFMNYSLDGFGSYLQGSMIIYKL